MSLHFINEDIKKHLADVEAFADKIGLADQFKDKLDYLNNYAEHANTRCLLFKDFAPASFAFTMQRWCAKTQEYVYWFEGGLIYHGPHDGWGSGSAPTFAVTITSEHGWSVHT